VQDERLWRAAQRIPLLDWRLGDPLLLLHDLSPERFDLVLAEPSFGLRVPVASDPDDPRGRVDIAGLVLWPWHQWWLTTVPCSSIRPMTSFGRHRPIGVPKT
jgi:hypothetical protein